MNADRLRNFLIEVQKQEKATELEAQAIIDQLRHIHRKGLNLEAFFKYLFSDSNLPFKSQTV